MDFSVFLHECRSVYISRMPRAEKVLSIGCAGTWYFEWFDKCYRYPLNQHIGIDINPRPDDLPAHITWIQQDGSDLSSIDSRHVDMVFAGQFIEHITWEQQVRLLAEVNRVLKPGGIFVLDSPNYAVTNRYGWKHPEHVHELSFSQICDLLRIAGLEVTGSHGILPTTLLGVPPRIEGKFLQENMRFPVLCQSDIGKAINSDPQDSFIWWVTARKVTDAFDRTKLHDCLQEYYRINQDKKTALPPELIEIASDGHHLCFKVRPDTIDADVVREVAHSRYYLDARYLLEEGSTVIDVGAHIGSFSVLAAARGARVWAVEPIPSNYALVVENISLNGFQDRVKALNAAVWSSTCDRTMRIADENTGGSGFYYHKDTVPEVPVHCYRLDDLMDSEGIARCDLLKLDCEGSEFEILNALGQASWQRIKAIVAEYHRVPGYSPAQLQRLLARQGFMVANQPLDMGGGLGYFLAVRPPAELPLLQSISVSEAESPITRLPLIGSLWRVLRRPFHRLVVFYLNQIIAMYNRHQRQAYVYIRVLSQQAQQQEQDTTD